MSGHAVTRVAPSFGPVAIAAAAQEPRERTGSAGGSSVAKDATQQAFTYVQVASERKSYAEGQLALA